VDPIVTPLLVLLGSVGAGVLAYRHNRRRMEKTRRAWEEAARTLGARFDPIGGPWYRRTPAQIQAELDGTRVLVDHFTVSTGKTSTTYTRARGYGAEPGALRISVVPERGLAALGKTLGAQDIELGDAAFDEHFVVKSSDEPFARAWLAGEFVAYARGAPRYSFSVKEGKTVAQTVGLEQDPAVLAAVARATAALAGGGARLLARWRACAEELGATLEARGDGWAPDESTVLRADVGGVPVIIDGISLSEGLLMKSARVLTRVRAIRLSACPPEERWAAYRGKRPPAAEELTPIAPLDGMEGWEWRAADAERTRARFGPALRLRAAALGPEVVSADERAVTLLVPGVETDAARLREAAEVVAALAARGPDAPYR
jgi:hypothetical protein